MEAIQSAMLLELDMSPTVQIMIGGGVLLVVAMIFGVFMLRARRRTLETPPPAGEAFSLEEVRQLHKRGLISDEEFQRLRAIALNQALEKTAQKPLRPPQKADDESVGPAPQ